MHGRWREWPLGAVCTVSTSNVLSVHINVCQCGSGWMWLSPFHRMNVGLVGQLWTVPAWTVMGRWECLNQGSAAWGVYPWQTLRELHVWTDCTSIHQHLRSSYSCSSEWALLFLRVKCTHYCITVCTGRCLLLAYTVQCAVFQVWIGSMHCSSTTYTHLQWLRCTSNVPSSTSASGLGIVHLSIVTSVCLVSFTIIMFEPCNMYAHVYTSCCSWRVMHATWRHANTG